MLDKEIQEQFESVLDESLKEDIAEIKKELARLSDGKEYSTFDEIEQEVIDKFCEENKLEVYTNFKDSMKTPFAIAKYMNMYVDQEKNCVEVEKDLSSLLNKEKINWVIHRDFTNEITIYKVTEAFTSSMQQKLTIVFKKDLDTEKLMYFIKSRDGIWEISKSNLKALAEGGIIKQDICSIGSLSPSIKTLSDKEFSFEIGDKFIITCCQK